MNFRATEEKMYGEGAYQRSTIQPASNRRKIRPNQREEIRYFL